MVISASHNPVEDNGIKFFSVGGFKLSDDEEAAIERAVHEILKGNDDLARPTGAGVGTQRQAGDAAEEYIAFLTGQFPLDLSGLRIAVDCGNGAASRIAPEVLRRLGAEVTVYHAEPNGVNINVGCGSTHPAVICQAVKETGADLGFTYDGDADRMLAVDERGQLVDGDHILAILASDMMERGVLRNRKIAATPYSNLGLRLALEAIGASVVETAGATATCWRPCGSWTWCWEASSRGTLSCWSGTPPATGCSRASRPGRPESDGVSPFRPWRG